MHMLNLNNIFYIYFLAKLDKHVIKIIKGFDYDDEDRSWAE